MRHSLPVEGEVAYAPAVHVVEHPQPAAARLARLRAEDRRHEVRRVHRHLPPPITAQHRLRQSRLTWAPLAM